MKTLGSTLLILVGNLLPVSLTAAPVLDPFGVAELHPSPDQATAWYSKWSGGEPRVLGNQVDPEDPWFDTDHGEGRYALDGKGVMTVTGNLPRMYVYDPTGARPSPKGDMALGATETRPSPGGLMPAGASRLWHNVEITFYGMRVSEAEPVGWAGLMAYARTDHRRDADTCATRGYGARLLYDGRADFEKETAHGKSNGYVQAAMLRPWPGGGAMPRDVWIGYKFIVRDSEDGGSVKLELWMDLANGKDGGDWKLVTEFLDQGDWGKDADACTPGVDPAQALTGPHPVVYLRNDGLGEMRLKWFSVREIAPITGK